MMGLPRTTEPPMETPREVVAAGVHDGGKLGTDYFNCSSIIVDGKTFAAKMGPYVIIHQLRVR